MSAFFNSNAVNNNYSLKEIVMKRLHIFILKSYLGPLVATFFISMFILLMQFLWRYIDELVGKGLETSVIAELLLYVSTTLVPMALPLAVLLASIMTFGNLGENYELIALKAAGISLFRVMYPLIMLTIFMTLFAFFFSNNVLPVANLKASVLLFDIKEQKPELSIKEGVFTNLEDYSIKVANIDKETGMMHDLIIYNHSKKSSANNEVTIADSGKIIVDDKRGVTEFILFNGSVYTEIKGKGKKRKNHPFRRVHYGEQRMVIEMKKDDFKRTDESVFAGNSSRMLSISQLEHYRDSLTKKLSAKHMDFASQAISGSYFKRSPVHSIRMSNERIKKRNAMLKERLERELKAKKELEEKKTVTGDTGSVKKDNKQKAQQKLITKKSASRKSHMKIKEIPVVKGSLSADSLFNTMFIGQKVSALNKALGNARRINTKIQMEKTHQENQKEVIRRHIIEWHKKFTLSFACLIFFFIGAPLGSIIRKGGLGTPVVISVVFFIIYYIISMMGERSAREGVMDPWEGMWLSSLILLPIGVALTWQAVSDSSVLNSDLYINFFRRFGLYKEKKPETKNEKLVVENK